MMKGIFGKTKIYVVYHIGKIKLSGFCLRICHMHLAIFFQLSTVTPSERRANESVSEKLTARLTTPINKTKQRLCQKIIQPKSPLITAYPTFAEEKAIWRISSGRLSKWPTTPVKPSSIPKARLPTIEP